MASSVGEFMLAVEGAIGEREGATGGHASGRGES